jgi:hypothetical protein
MNIFEFIRVVLVMICQKDILLTDKMDIPMDEWRKSIDKYHTSNSYYKNSYFSLPVIYANDGWFIEISMLSTPDNPLQSENGYDTFGLNFINASVVMVSEPDDLMNPDTDIVPLYLIQLMLNKHGGINWSKTCSVDNLQDFIKV